MEGDSLLRWRSEAWQVALLTALGQIFLCVGVLLFARMKRLRWSHVISWSAPFHIALAAALAAVVYWRALD